MADFKYLEIAKALEESIERGDYRERLPGTRVLGSVFAVNPRTVSRALEVLANRGVVLPDGNRGCLLPKPHLPRRRTGNVVIYSNHSVTSEIRGPRGLFNGLISGMDEYNLKPVFISSAEGRLMDDAEFWLSCKVDGFIFVFSSFRQEIASQMALRRIPVVSANRMEDGLKISWVDFDHEKAVADMLEFLLRAGYRRIALLDQLRPAYVRRHFEQAYRKTMQRHRLYDPELFCCLETTERRGEEVSAHIGRMMALANPPAAILCGQLERDAALALLDYPVKPILVPTCDVARPDGGTRPRLAYSYQELGERVFDVFWRIRETGAVIQELVPMRIEI